MRVGYFIDNIYCSDADFHAAIADIKLNDTPTGLRNDFERTVTLLILVNPVGNKTKGKSLLDDIFSASALKSGRGTSGVEFRYYKPY